MLELFPLSTLPIPPPMRVPRIELSSARIPPSLSLFNA